MALLSFENVTIAYQENIVLENISFAMDKGEFVYLIGKTGSGKSSLLKTIYADLPVISGNIYFDGQPIQNLPKKQVPFLRRKIGIVFQDFQLLPDRSIGENIAFALRATGHTDANYIKQRVLEVLNIVGLATKVNYMPHQISGGEQQRVVIARALANKPLLLIADEPTGNLDPEASENILQILQNIAANGTAILMATHDHQLLLKFPNKTIECKNRTLFTL